MSTSPVTKSNGNGGEHSVCFSPENGSGTDMPMRNEGSAFQVVSDTISKSTINAVFEEEDFLKDVIIKVSKDQIVPYSDLPFSKENQSNIKNMLTGITFETPSILTLSSLITNKTRRESIIEAGKALKGLSVLKMLEYIVSEPELHAQIKIIFKYPTNGGFFKPTNYILSKIREKFFSGLSSYLDINAEETAEHLQAFIKAIGKDKIVIEEEPLPVLFQRAVEQKKWEAFFIFVIFDEDDE